MSTLRRVILYIIGLALVGVTAFGALALSATKEHRESGEARERRDVVARGIRVRVAQVHVEAVERSVSLPGDVRPFEQASLLAKVPGYLKWVRIERGDRVKRGQILGVLESPETDQQVHSARADLANRRQLALRNRRLVKKGLVSEQEKENADAALSIAEANLQRVLALQEYEKIRAPFDGVITARRADPGALMQGAQSLGDLADLDRLRIVVNVGQGEAPFVHEGDVVQLEADGRPATRIQAKVTHISGALDPRTRTMAVEVVLGSSDRRFLPGEFVHATLRLHTDAMPVIPARALFLRGEKAFVAVIRDGKAVRVPVIAGETNGKFVQIRSGLSGTETVALDLGMEAEDGAKVDVVRDEAAAPAR